MNTVFVMRYAYCYFCLANLTILQVIHVCSCKMSPQKKVIQFLTSHRFSIYFSSSATVQDRWPSDYYF